MVKSRCGRPTIKISTNRSRSSLNRGDSLSVLSSQRASSKTRSPAQKRRFYGDPHKSQEEHYVWSYSGSGRRCFECNKGARCPVPTHAHKHYPLCVSHLSRVGYNKAGSGRSTTKCRKSAHYPVFTPAHKHYPCSVSYHHRVHISRTGSRRSCFKCRKCARCTVLTPAHENDATHTHIASAYEPSMSWQCFKCR